MGCGMTELLTAAQMRAVEAAAIASGAVTGLELMERAGRGVVEAVFAEWPELRAGTFRAVVLCGPGGNGGDGFVVARLLREWGWEVEVFLYGEPAGMPADARVNYERWVGMGEVRGADTFAPWDTDAHLYVDALFGTGLTRPVEGNAAVVAKALVDSARNHKAQLVAVDVPSGLCSDSGRFLNPEFWLAADLTVTFQYLKRGHVLADGPVASGKVALVDIGLDPKLSRIVLVGKYEPASRRKLDTSPIVRRIDGYLYTPEFMGTTSILDKGTPGKDGSVHKFSHGHALILSGPPGHGGAARLAARGALRIGAGVVSVGCGAEAVAEHAARLDAVMVKVVAGAAGLREVLADARINAVCIGPGLGVDALGAEMVAVVLGSGDGPPPPTPPHAGEGRRDAGAVGLDATGGGQVIPLPLVGRGAVLRPTVLDADALTLLARDAGLFGLLHAGCVLTPHAGEFARLFPEIAAKLEAPAVKGPAYSKVDACREAAARAGCVVLFKGADTVIASPDGRCAINSAAYERSAPWLATAGSGDVLAGFITGLLARGFAPMQAAETAAWLHVECARSFGPGLIAEDLPEELPKVFRALGV